MGFLDKAKGLGTKTVEEGKKYAVIAKLNITISNYEDQIKESKIAIGNILMETGLPVTDESPLQEQLDKIAELNGKIEETRSQINEIKKINICKSCNAEVPVGEKFCGKCGAPMQTVEDVIQNEPDTGHCKECGAELAPGMAFCSNCGAKIESE